MKENEPQTWEGCIFLTIDLGESTYLFVKDVYVINVQSKVNPLRKGTI